MEPVYFFDKGEALTTEGDSEFCDSLCQMEVWVAPDEIGGGG